MFCIAKNPTPDTRIQSLEPLRGGGESRGRCGLQSLCCSVGSMPCFAFLTEHWGPGCQEAQICLAASSLRAQDSSGAVCCTPPAVPGIIPHLTAARPLWPPPRAVVATLAACTMSNSPCLGMMRRAACPERQQLAQFPQKGKVQALSEHPAAFYRARPVPGLSVGSLTRSLLY